MYTDFDRYRDICIAFERDGFITGPSRVIKRGKEATVLCCAAAESLGVDEVALKIYKDAEARNFRNNAEYLRGKVWKRRDLAHLHAFKHELWVDTEYQTLRTLSEAGVRVPKPYVQIDHGVLMEHVVMDGEDAPQLKDVRLSEAHAADALQEILDALDTMLDCRVVHGDLSAFNILYDGERPVIIDFPQAVHTQNNDHAWELFRRDVENVFAHFARLGVCSDTDAGEAAEDLWTRHYPPAPGIMY